MDANSIIAALYIVNAIVILWVVTFAVRDARKFRPYLPLLVIVLSFCLIAAIFFYDLLLSYWHFVFTLLYVAGLVWLFIDYMRIRI